MNVFTPAPAGVATTRQKNCNSCVQTKRRCDRRTPICSRCVEKKLPCVYGKAKAAKKPVQHGAEPSSITSYAASPMLANSASACSPFPSDISLDLGYLGNLSADLETELAQPAPTALDDDNISVGSFMNLINSTNPPPRDQWLVQAHDGYPDDRPGTPVDEEVQRSYQKISTFCLTPPWHQMKPWDIYDPTSIFYFINHRIKGFVTDMANKNATPFLHRFLYKNYTPQCILSCFSTSVLYTNRTPANTIMVMQAVHANIHELINTEKERILATPTDKLARTQALFLYLVICLFDGDVSLRVKGEDSLPLFHTWMEELCKIRENLGDLAQVEDSVMRQQPPVDWERWIFAESLRRTTMMAYAALSLYTMMKDSTLSDNDPAGSRSESEAEISWRVWGYAHRWTLARSLWEASSSSEFYRQWREKPQFIIVNFSFEKFVRHGRGEDVDQFAEILLSMYLGIEDAKEFIAGRTSNN